MGINSNNNNNLSNGLEPSTTFGTKSGDNNNNDFDNNIDENSIDNKNANVAESAGESGGVNVALIVILSTLGCAFIIFGIIAYKRMKKNGDEEKEAVEGLGMTKMSVASDSGMSGRKSTSKYDDMLPPTRPPPIGAKPVLTGDAMNNRALPATPPGNTTGYLE